MLPLPDVITKRRIEIMVVEWAILYYHSDDVFLVNKNNRNMVFSVVILQLPAGGPSESPFFVQHLSESCSSISQITNKYSHVNHILSESDHPQNDDSATHLPSQLVRISNKSDQHISEAGRFSVSLTLSKFFEICCWLALKRY